MKITCVVKTAPSGRKQRRSPIPSLELYGDFTLIFALGGRLTKGLLKRVGFQRSRMDEHIRIACALYLLDLEVWISEQI